VGRAIKEVVQRTMQWARGRATWPGKTAGRSALPGVYRLESDATSLKMPWLKHLKKKCGSIRYTSRPPGYHPTRKPEICLTGLLRSEPFFFNLSEK